MSAGSQTLGLCAWSDTQVPMVLTKSSSAEAASSSEEENSVDATGEQQDTEGDAQHEGDREAQGRPASSQLLEESHSCHRPKRHLSRSLDLSRRSVSSRAAKHQKQGERVPVLEHSKSASSNCIALCDYERYHCHLAPIGTFCTCCVDCRDTNDVCPPIISYLPRGVDCCKGTRRAGSALMRALMLMQRAEACSPWPHLWILPS